MGATGKGGTCKLFFLFFHKLTVATDNIVIFVMFLAQRRYWKYYNH